MSAKNYHILNIFLQKDLSSKFQNLLNLKIPKIQKILLVFPLVGKFCRHRRLVIYSQLTCFCSLQALHKKLLKGEIIQREKHVEDISGEDHWNCDPKIVHAVWKLVGICGSNDANKSLLSDFISRVI